MGGTLRLCTKRERSSGRGRVHWVKRLSWQAQVGGWDNAWGRVGVMMPFSISSEVAVAAEPHECIADGALDRMTGIIKLTNGF